MSPKTKKPLPKPHEHSWRESGRGCAQTCDYFFTCSCDATKEVFIEQDGVRTELWEPTQEKTR